MKPAASRNTDSKFHLQHPHVKSGRVIGADLEPGGVWSPGEEGLHQSSGVVWFASAFTSIRATCPNNETCCDFMVEESSGCSVKQRRT